MRYLTSHCILLICILFSCNSNNEDKNNGQGTVKPYPHIVNIEEGLKTTSLIKLSEIADSIRYIVLSKDKKVIIGRPNGLQMTDNEIYFFDESLVMRFDIQGNFLNSFGNTGRGPLEYLRGSIFTITASKDKILILRSAMQDYLLFKPNGEYIGKNNISYPRNLYGFANISDSAFLFTFWFHGAFMKGDILSGMSYIAGIFDPAGKPIKVIEHPLKNIKIAKEDISRVLSPAPTYTFFDNKVVLLSAGDTIYEVTSSSIIPGFIMKWGSLPHKQSIDDWYFRQTESSNKVSIFNRVFETSVKTYFVINRFNDYFILEYNKITGLSRSMPVDPENIGLINDLDGGDSFFPGWTNREGDIWISSVDAIDFKEKQSDEFLSTSAAVYPEMKERLRTFVKDLKADDNPILKIVYLKKLNCKK